MPEKPASTDSITSKVFGKGGTRAALTVLGKGSLLKKAPFPGVSNFSSVSALVCGCGSDGKALGGPAGRRRRTGDLGEEGIAEGFDVIADVIEIIQVNLLFADDRFKQFGGQDIAVVHTDFAKLVVHEDGVVFTVAVAAVNRFDFLLISESITGLCTPGAL